MPCRVQRCRRQRTSHRHGRQRFHAAIRFLPVGASSEPFDIAATDGTVIDVDAPGGNSNPSVTVPANFSGHTHVALTRSS